MADIAATPISRRRRSAALKWRNRTVLRLGQFAVVAAFFAFWQIQASQSQYLTLVFSTPQLVLERLIAWFRDPAWWQHLKITLLEATLGYALGLVIALVLVALLAPNPRLARFASPYIGAFNALPKIALAPLFIFWFGTTVQAKAYFVASLISFIIFYGIYSGLRTIDSTLVGNMRLLGANRRQMLFNLYIPAIITWLIGSLRLAMAWALLSAVIAEYLGSIRGIGYLVAHGQMNLRTDIVIAGILIVATIAVVIDRLLVAVETSMTKWRAF